MANIANNFRMYFLFNTFHIWLQNFEFSLIALHKMIKFALIDTIWL